MKEKFVNPSKLQKFADLILLLIGVSFGILIAEGMLKIIEPSQLSTTHQPCIYLQDGQFGYRYKPNASGWIYRNFEMDNVVNINSMGFHDIEHEKNKGGNVPRILAVGDSFTASIHVETSKGWTQTLQRELRKMGYPSSDVVNLGLDGTGTDVHLSILKHYLPIFQPDVAILAFFKNDFSDIKRNRGFRECYQGYVLVYKNDEQRDRLRDVVDKYKPGPFSIWLFNNLYLFRATTYLYTKGILLRSNFLTPSLFDIPVNQKSVNPRELDSLLQQFVVLSQQYNFKLFVIPVPPKEGATGSLDTLQRNISATTLTQLDIIDISRSVQNLLMKENTSFDEMFWRFDGHFNTYGNHVFGRAVAEVIDEYYKLPR